MKSDKKTKIVATIGPVTSSKAMLKKIIEAGVNVCRINFSHGSHEDHLKVIRRVAEINKENGYHTAILADLQGPKIRIGEIEGGAVNITKGERITFSTKKIIGNATKVYINYDQFPKDVTEGERILIDDGKLALKIISTNQKDEAVAEVLNSGVLSSKKGVNLPNTKVSLPSLTEKDRIDLEFAIEHNVEWIGLSFVRSARDIIELKHIIKSKGKTSRVIAKIEKPEAVADIDDIIAKTDAIMVARGDLGVEIPMEEVPLVQKEIVKKCLVEAKPVIIATQMMESMITNISPTRAEVNDVANAVLDGADAVMLSGETSVGAYPLQVIESMVKIIEQMETSESIYHQETVPTSPDDERFISDSICFNAGRLAARVNAKAIVTMTHSGYTAIKISSFRPKAGTYAFTGNHALLNTLSLVWGVRGFYYDKFVSTDHTIADIKFILKKNGYVKEKDLIINLASMPISDKGQSNMLKLSFVD
ncbi:pyruvate kinase [Acidiluteibacter ferrifornacis]|nr:pyruvate kinase [Acidiluteibacter ferrifornacis]